MDNKRISEIVGEEMIKQDANRYRDIRKILTIPKSIAEMLDKEIAADAVTKFAMFHEGFDRFWLSYELQMYCAKKKIML